MAITILDEKDKRDLEQEIGKKLDRSGWTPDKYLGVDNEGNVTEKDIPERSADKSLGITGADIGQTIVVKSVDENGKPTEWESVDMPSGGSGGGETWRLLNSVVTEEDVDRFTVTMDSNGKPFALKKIRILMRIRGNTSGVQSWIRLYLNDLEVHWYVGLSGSFAVVEGKDYYWTNRADLSVQDGYVWCNYFARSQNNQASKDCLDVIGGSVGNPMQGVKKIEKIHLRAAGSGVGAGTEVIIWGVDL